VIAHDGDVDSDSVPLTTQCIVILKTSLSRQWIAPLLHCSTSQMRPIATDWSSVVCRSFFLLLSVSLLVTTVSPANAAEWIVMLFRMLIWVGPRNHVLDGVQIPMQ